MDDKLIYSKIANILKETKAITKTDSMETFSILLKLLYSSKEIADGLDLNDQVKKINIIIGELLHNHVYFCKGHDLGELEEYVKLYFDYNPITGIISRKDRKKGLGHYDSYGYLKIKIKGKSFMAHRIAWFLYYGEMPQKEIDHINGDRSDNRISNLRVVSRYENNLNRRYKPNKSTGYIGISPKNCKTHVLYQVHYKNKNYYFESVNEAVEFRKKKGLPI